MSTQVEQLALRLHDTFSKNQLDQTLELVSDDVAVNAYAFGLSFSRKEGFMDFMQGFKTAFPDIAIRHSNIVSNGDNVAVEFTATGTHTGPLQTPAGSIPPSGKKINLTVSEFMIFRDGKLVQLNNYQDAGSLMRQIGVM